MAETRERPRIGVQRIMSTRPSLLFYDSWAACPLCAREAPGVMVSSERDGLVWFNYDRHAYRCTSAHEFNERTALWEVQSR